VASSVTVADGRLAVSPAVLLTPADRVALRAGKEDLLRFLAPPPEPWSDATVAALSTAADDLVERLGVPNNHLELRALAEVLVAVLPRRDMGELLARVRAYELAAHRIAGVG
jgi:hypothetical protein